MFLMLSFVCLIATPLPATNEGNSATQPEPGAQDTQGAAPEHTSAAATDLRVETALDEPLASAEKLVVEEGEVLLRPFRPRLDDAWVVLPVGIATGFALVYDARIYRAIHGGLPDPMLGSNRFSYWGSYLGDGGVNVGIFAIVGAVGYHHEKERRVALEGLEALAAVGLRSRALKLVVREERPSFDGIHKHFFGPVSADSFPSGHAMTAFATASVIGNEYPMLAPVAYGLAAYLGIARVQQSTHWMSDVLIGGGLGYLLGKQAVALHARVALQPLLSNDATGLALCGVLP